MNRVWQGNLDGRLYISNRSEFDEWVSAQKPRPVEVIIRSIKKIRSTGKAGENNHNGYLWKIVYRMIAEKLGWSVDDVHEYLKNRLLTERNFNGPTKPGSTAGMASDKFHNYCKQIQQLASEGFPDPETGKGWPELAMNIPDPNEVDYE